MERLSTNAYVRLYWMAYYWMVYYRRQCDELPILLSHGFYNPYPHYVS